MARYGAWLAAVGVLVSSTEASAQKADRWAGKGVMLREDGVRPGRVVAGHLFRGGEPLDADEVYTVHRSAGGCLELEGVSGWVAAADVVRAGEPAAAHFTRKIREEPAAGKWYGRRAVAANMTFKLTIPEVGEARTNLVPPGSAVTDFIQAVKLAPDETYWRIQLGSLYLVNGVLDKAEEQFNAAIRMAPKRAYWYHARAMLWLARHDLGKALGDLDRAIELDPEAPRQYYTRSTVRYALHLQAECFRDLDRAMQLRPADEANFLQRAAIRIHSEDLAGGVADLDRVLELNPLHEKARLWRGAIRFKTRDYNGALADYRGVQRTSPMSPDGYWREAYVLANAQDGAVRDSRRAVTMAQVAVIYAGVKAESNVYCTLASAHAEAGEFDAAVAAQEKANALMKAAHPVDEEDLAEGVQRLSCYGRKETCRD